MTYHAPATHTNDRRRPLQARLGSLVFATAFGALSAPCLRAADVTPETVASENVDLGSDSPVYLDKYIVQGADTSDTTLPTRPTSSVYGLEVPYQDIPRSITEISPEQFQINGVSSFNDFALYSPAVNTNTGAITNYGAPSIRGAIGDVYQDGIRTLARQGNAHPFDINSYDAVDIVAGPAPVIYGPSARTSGYVDYLTKQAYFDTDHTTVNLLAGQWDTGGAGYHQDFNWQVDTGGPIIADKLAYRVSYEEENSESYYQKVWDQYQDIYATLLWRPASNLTIDWNAEYGNFDNENTGGWNRVSQQLIDGGIYLAGPATPIIKGSFSPTGYYSPVYVPGVGFNGTEFISRTLTNADRYVAGNALTGAPTAAHPGTIVGWVLDPSLVHPTRIYGYQNLLNATNPPIVTQVFSTQLRIRKEISPETTLLNTTYYQFFGNVSAYNTGFFNWIHDDTLEDRLELQQKTEHHWFGTDVVESSNSGVSVRDEYVLNFKDSDPAAVGQGGDAYDLTTNVVSRNALLGAQVYPLYSTQNPVLSQYFGYLNFTTSSIPAPVDPTYSVTPGGSGTGLSTATNETSTQSIGLYRQENLRFGDRFIWDIGARLTGVWSRLGDPLVDPTSATSAALGSTVDHISALIPSASNSFSYKPAPWATIYITYDYVQAQNGMTTGSPTWAAGNKLSAKNFHSVSELYETGGKFELIPGKLFGTVSAYHQTRDLSVVSVDGNSEIAKGLYRGIETSFRYEFSRQFNVGVNYNYLSANYLNNTVSAEPIVDDNATVLQPNLTLAAGGWRIQDLPRQNLTLFASYQLASGFGVSPSLTAHSSEIYNYTGVGTPPITIPGKYDVNVTLFYAARLWRISLDLLNVTDQQDFAGAAPLEPFAVRLRFSFHI